MRECGSALPLLLPSEPVGALEAFHDQKPVIGFEGPEASGAPLRARGDTVPEPRESTGSVLSGRL